jgi:hypothetical protein
MAMLDTTEYVRGEFRQAQKIIQSYHAKKPILTLEKELLERLVATLEIQTREYDFIPENFLKETKEIIIELKNTNP